MSACTAVGISLTSPITNSSRDGACERGQAGHLVLRQRERSQVEVRPHELLRLTRTGGQQHTLLHHPAQRHLRRKPVPREEYCEPVQKLSTGLETELGFMDRSVTSILNRSLVTVGYSVLRWGSCWDTGGDLAGRVASLSTLKTHSPSRRASGPCNLDLW